jgi:hypothetical protein
MSQIAREAFLDEVYRIGGKAREWVISKQMLRPALSSGLIKSATRILIRDRLIEERHLNYFMHYRLTELGVLDCVNRAELKRIKELDSEEPEEQIQRTENNS